MLSAMLRTVRTHGLLARGDRVLVAVSGGPDSMALLSALWEIAGRLGITLEAATVDHGLRPEAAAEADLVRERAAALEVPWHLVRVDVAGARRRDGGSLQDTARRVRLAALAELADRRGARRVALAHQADDQAETVLFRIVRGTGLAGLGGIPYARDPFVRPLLDVWRVDVLRYLRRRSIPFAEDPSNADLRFTRARLRHVVLPALGVENPRVREALVALAAAARGLAVPGDLPSDVGRRAAAVIDRLRGEGGARSVDLAGGRIAEVEYGEVRVGPRRGRTRAGDPEGARGASSSSSSSPSPLPPLSIAGPGAYHWPGCAAVLVSAHDGATSTAARADGAACFDADVLAWPLAVRQRRPGDRMRPRGGRGSRKLSDLMIDAKVSRNERGRLPVVTTADDVVLFVPGLRPADWGRPTPATRRLVRLALAE